MAKRGRKPKEKKQYFSLNEEEALVRYLNSTNENEKNMIFSRILYPALTKMIESIIRRYKLFVPDEEFDLNFSDTISYLLTKVANFRTTIIGYTELEEIPDDNTIEFVEMPYDVFKQKTRNATENDPLYIKVTIPAKRMRRCDNDGYENIHKYYQRETKHYKAYSYCGTVCKNYLKYKCKQYSKQKQRNLKYEDISDELENKFELEPKINLDTKDLPNETLLVYQIADQIEDMILHRDEHMLIDEEIIVGNALINLLRNWEEVLPCEGSSKLQKNTILYFLREETMMSTKEIRMYMKKYKNAYYVLKDVNASNM